MDGTDTSDYTFWSQGQPDSKDKADYCAYSWNSHDGYWDDRPCSEAVPYICQQQKSIILNLKILAIPNSKTQYEIY